MPEKVADDGLMTRLELSTRTEEDEVDENEMRREANKQSVLKLTKAVRRSLSGLCLSLSS